MSNQGWAAITRTIRGATTGTTLRAAVVIAGLGAVACSPAWAGAPGRTIVVRSVGEFTATTARPAGGTFEFVERIRGDGRTRPGYRIAASGLDASRDENGRRVAHGAFLLPAGGGDEVFLGRLEVSGKGDGRLRKRDAAEILTGAGAPLRALAGSTVEVRGPAGTMLRGTLPAFALDGANTSTDRRETYGLFVPISSSTPKSGPGRFAFRTDEHATGEIRNRTVIESPGLPVTSTYTVYLFGPRTILLGRMVNNARLGAKLSLDSRRAPIPGGIVRWSEFDGGRIEVRRGGTVMLRGAITIFRAASERVADAGWARSRATVELIAAEGAGAARGLLTASVLTKPRRRLQEIRVRTFDLPAADAPYVVATLEPDGVRHELGRFYVRGTAAAGGFRLTTRRGDATPPGGVLGQAGRPIEVTNAAGSVILTGTFPALD